MMMIELTKPDDATLEIRRMLNAPQELVYEAWTSPEHIPHWMHPEPGMKVASVSIDLRVGGKFRLQMQSPEGEFFTAVGEYREVQAPARVVYTWDWEIDGSGTEFGEVEGNTSLITMQFIPHEDRTELVLTHSRFASVESRDNHSRGWSRAVESLAAFLETKES